MARIYIIAGPPGIGKSTSGYHFIPEGTDILDPDEISQRYKEQGWTNYKDIGNMRFAQAYQQLLFKEKDFGIELNLGFNHITILSKTCAILIMTIRLR